MRVLDHVLGIGVASAILCFTSANAETTNSVRPDQVVGALENTFGVHPGERRNHIKGTCAAGEFVGLPDAQRYTRSALFSGTPVPVIARFSVPGGNPHISDSSRTPRGLALEFKLTDGSKHHMTMLNTPVFGASSPQTFLNDVMSKQPHATTGKPDPERIKSFHATHPDSQAQHAFLANHNPPPSWANSSYFGIHTFKFVDAQDATTLVRWRFVPKDGEKELSSQQLAASSQNFLEAKLIERVKRGPIQWDMVVTIGEPGDTQTDPTQLWPKGRKEVKVGTLSIVSSEPQRDAECEKVNFDPLVMSDGIQPTNDPVLLFRSPAYAISFGKRISGQ